MTDIVFYVKPNILNHKKRKSNSICWWSMKHPPINFKAGERIFFAVNGYVLGSFKCEIFNPDDPVKTIIWVPTSWEPLKAKIPLLRRHWRGLRYRWWDIKRKPDVRKNEKQ